MQASIHQRLGGLKLDKQLREVKEVYGGEASPSTPINSEPGSVVLNLVSRESKFTDKYSLSCLAHSSSNMRS